MIVGWWYVQRSVLIQHWYLPLCKYLISSKNIFYCFCLYFFLIVVSWKGRWYRHVLALIIIAFFLLLLLFFVLFVVDKGDIEGYKSTMNVCLMLGYVCFVSYFVFRLIVQVSFEYAFTCEKSVEMSIDLINMTESDRPEVSCATDRTSKSNYCVTNQQTKRYN